MVAEIKIFREIEGIGEVLVHQKQLSVPQWDFEKTERQNADDRQAYFELQADKIIEKMKVDQEGLVPYVYLQSKANDIRVFNSLK